MPLPQNAIFHVPPPPPPSTHFTLSLLHSPHIHTPTAPHTDWRHACTRHNQVRSTGSTTRLAPIVSHSNQPAFVPSLKPPLCVSQAALSISRFWWNVTKGNYGPRARQQQLRMALQKCNQQKLQSRMQANRDEVWLLCCAPPSVGIRLLPHCSHTQDPRPATPLAQFLQRLTSSIPCSVQSFVADNCVLCVRSMLSPQPFGGGDEERVSH